MTPLSRSCFCLFISAPKGCFLGPSCAGHPDVGGSRCREGEDSSLWPSGSQWCCRFFLRGAFLGFLRISVEPLGLGLIRILVDLEFLRGFLEFSVEFYGLWIDCKFLSATSELGMISFHLHLALFRPKLGEICCSIRFQKKLQFKQGASHFRDSQTLDGCVYLIQSH